MAEISTIARPYAEAAFRVAESAAGGNLSEWADVLTDLAAIASHPDMQAVISNPRLTADQIYALLAGAGKPALSSQAQNFVRELIENGRISALPEIAAQFRTLKNAKEGKADAEITSAFALTDAQVTELVASLEKKFKTRLKPTVSVDASLIGGIRVVVGDEVLDTSIRSRLEQMRVALTA